MNLEKAFNFYESMVQEGKIKSYGISSKAAFNLDPEIQAIKNGTPLMNYEIVEISDIINLAEKVGGKDHHFKFVQTPFSYHQP